VEVAPVAFIGFGEHAAGRAVGAGGEVATADLIHSA
jgi:hypothetical protein